MTTAQQKPPSLILHLSEATVAQEVSPMFWGIKPGVNIHSGPSKGRVVQSLYKAIHVSG